MGNQIYIEKPKDNLDKVEVYVKINRNNFEIIYKYSDVLEPYSGSLNYKYENLQISAIYKGIEYIEYLPFTFTEIIFYVPSNLLQFRHLFDNGIIFREFLENF